MDAALLIVIIFLMSLVFGWVFNRYRDADSEFDETFRVYLLPNIIGGIIGGTMVWAITSMATTPTGNIEVSVAEFVVIFFGTITTTLAGTIVLRRWMKKKTPNKQS